MRRDARGLDVELGFVVVQQLVVYLDAPPLGVGDHEAGVVGIEGDGGREGEAPFGFEGIDPATGFVHVGIGADVFLLPLGQFLSVADERGDVVPFGVERLNPVVRPVADVDVSVGVYGDVRGVVELAVTVAVAAEREDKLAIGVELLDAVVFVVGDVDEAAGVYGDAPRGSELAFATALPSPLG